MIRGAKAEKVKEGAPSESKIFCFGKVTGRDIQRVRQVTGNDCLNSKRRKGQRQELEAGANP